MKRVLFSVMALSIIFVAGCKKDEKYADVKETMTDMVACYESFFKSLEGASNAKDVAKALNTFTDELAPVIAKSKELQKKYPDVKFNEPGNQPKEIAAETKRLEELMTKFMTPDTLKKLMKYSQDPDVMKAQQHMMETIGKE